jgi:RNA-binding protein
MSVSLTNPQIRKLKALAQRLEPVLRVGKQGLTDAFLKSVAEELDRHELIKVKFADFKEEKKQLSPVLAEKTSSHLIARVGNVVVLYRENPNPTKRKIFGSKSELTVANGGNEAAGNRA